jgi:hypothetical protein
LTDNGVPPLSATNTFLVIVVGSVPDDPPVIQSIVLGNDIVNGHLERGGDSQLSAAKHHECDLDRLGGRGRGNHRLRCDGFTNQLDSWRTGEVLPGAHGAVVRAVFDNQSPSGWSGRRFCFEPLGYELALV